MDFPSSLSHIRTTIPARIRCSLIALVRHKVFRLQHVGWDVGNLQDQCFPGHYLNKLNWFFHAPQLKLLVCFIASQQKPLGRTRQPSHTSNSPSFEGFKARRFLSFPTFEIAISGSCKRPFPYLYLRQPASPKSHWWLSANQILQKNPLDSLGILTWLTVNVSQIQMRGKIALKQEVCWDPIQYQKSKSTCS